VGTATADEASCTAAVELAPRRLVRVERSRPTGGVDAGEAGAGAKMKPEHRRAAAWWLVIGSLVLATANVYLYLVGIFDEADMIFVTLILSWLAITLTAADILATSDVRVKEEESDSNSDSKGGDRSA
jgi:hypothetical protein